MAPPHGNGELVRSLVRIPGSGSDRTAGSECLDLSRVSTLAASVPVPQTLPQALKHPRGGRPPAQANKLGAKVLVYDGLLKISESNKRPNTETSTEWVPKRARLNVVYSAGQQDVNHTGNIVSVQTSGGPAIVLSVQGHHLQPKCSQTVVQSQSGISQSQPGSSVDRTSLDELVRERDILRQENRDLQKRLLLFQQLFKDKNRLASVVKHFGVEVVS